MDHPLSLSLAHSLSIILDAAGKTNLPIFLTVYNVKLYTILS